MVARDILIGGVLAATDRLVNQAGQGDWTSVAKTVEQRRMMLEALARSEPQSGEHEFVKALRAAAAESEAALAIMRQSVSTTPTPEPINRNGTLCTKA
jgi:hypothetical protein